MKNCRKTSDFLEDKPAGKGSPEAIRKMAQPVQYRPDAGCMACRFKRSHALRDLLGPASCAVPKRRLGEAAPGLFFNSARPRNRVEIRAATLPGRPPEGR